MLCGGCQTVWCGPTRQSLRLKRRTQVFTAQAWMLQVPGAVTSQMKVSCVSWCRYSDCEVCCTSVRAQQHTPPSTNLLEEDASLDQIQCTTATGCAHHDNTQHYVPLRQHLAPGHSNVCWRLEQPGRPTNSYNGGRHRMACFRFSAQHGPTQLSPRLCGTVCLQPCWKPWALQPAASSIMQQLASRADNTLCA